MESNEILSISQQFQWLKATDLMINMTKSFRSEEQRKNTPTSVLDDVLKCLATAVSAMKSESNVDNTADVSLVRYITETFRCLRNACAGCPQNQTVIGGNPSSLTDTQSVLELVKCGDCSPESVTLVKCALQFVGNVCVGHPHNQLLVCQYFLPMFRDVLHSPDNDVVNYTCMVIHNCLLPQEQQTASSQLPSHLQFDNDNFTTVILGIIQTTVLRDLEWGLYVIEDLLQISDFLQTLYARLQQSEKLFVVEVLITVLKKVEDNSAVKKDVISVDNLSFLANEVKTQSLQILKAGLVDSHHSQAPFLLVKILEGLGLATSLHTQYGCFQNDTDLLVCCLNLLRGIHDIGQEGGNHFTSVEKVTESDLIDPQHPAFGLKRDLIRLIANLVYRHTDNQNKVREMDGIPLILDQSNMDGRNPFITQWVVLAVRNLCEDNPQNKAYMVGLKLEGLADSVQILQDFGVQAEIRGDKVIVKPSDDGTYR